MQSHTANELHIKVAQPQCPIARFPNYGKRFGQNVIELLAVCQALFELVSLGSQFSIAQCRDLIGQGIHSLDYLAHTLQLPIITGTKNHFQKIANHQLSTCHK